MAEQGLGWTSGVLSQHSQASPESEEKQKAGIAPVSMDGVKMGGVSLSDIQIRDTLEAGIS